MRNKHRLKRANVPRFVRPSCVTAPRASGLRLSRPVSFPVRVFPCTLRALFPVLPFLYPSATRKTAALVLACGLLFVVSVCFLL